MNAPGRPAPDTGTDAVLAVDSGGSGLRAALAVRGGTGAPLASQTPVRTGADGIAPAHMMEQLVPMVRELMARTGGTTRLGAVAIGAAGMATLGGALRSELPGALEKEFGTRKVALAADAVTAYVGALGTRPGAMVAAGTGLIALGTDLESWRRVDGWGHLLGDCGSGAWIGRAGLEAALRALDGRGGGSAALLERAERMFGPATELPGKVYPRTDRPAVLASFAPEVADAAREGGDDVAAGILRAAAGHIAEAAAAACPDSGSCDIALTGGLLGIGEPLMGPLRRELAQQVPHARQVPAAGDPLTGSVSIAVDLAADRLALPRDGRMLYVTPGDAGAV